MTDTAYYIGIEGTFAGLLAGLKQTWPPEDIAYVADLVAHAEYGEALENLVALGVRNGKGFPADSMSRIGDLGQKMGMDAGALLAGAARAPAAA